MGKKMSRNIVTGKTEFFKDIKKIQYEGKESDNPLAFKFYDPNLKVNGKTLEDHLRFAIAYWHTFGPNGADPFGMDTKDYPWLKNNDPLSQSMEKMDAAFEFISKIGAPFYCFHDFDIANPAPSFLESEKRLNKMVDYALEKQND